MTRLRLATVATLVLAGVGHATAADMAVKAPPQVLPSWSWTGVYVGGNAGYAWETSTSSTSGSPGVFDPLPGSGADLLASALASATPALSVASAGFIGGAQIGYNHQTGRFVAGIEADIDGTALRKTAVTSTLVGVPTLPTNSVSATATATNRLDYLATLRGRFGYTPVDRWLLYVTGGLAVGGVHSSITGTDLVLGPSFGITTTLATNAASSQARAGWTVGGGTEYALSSHWSLKAEALYYDLGRTNLNTTPASIETIAGGTGIGSVFASANRVFSTRWAGALARVGVNYRF